MVLRIQPGDKATIKSMEKCFISETKRGEASQIKCENHFDLLLWHQRAHPLWIRTTRSDCFTLKCSSDCVMLCEENAPNCGGQVSGFCIITMLPPTQHWVFGSFSRKMGWQRLCTPLLPGPDTLQFFPVAKNEEGHKGKHFQNIEEVKEKMTEALKAITLQEFQNCFEQWKKQWDKCIDSQGDYFEGD